MREKGHYFVATKERKKRTMRPSALICIFIFIDSVGGQEWGESGRTNRDTDTFG